MARKVGFFKWVDKKWHFWVLIVLIIIYDWSLSGEWLYRFPLYWLVVIFAYWIYYKIMGLWDWFFVKQPVMKWKGRPLYRRGGQIYWKGIRVNDDEFEAVRQNRAELRQYNYWVRKLNRRRKRR